MEGQAMTNNDSAYEIKQLKEQVVELVKEVRSLSAMVNPNNEMWDDQDMVKYWKVSKRTLATWRKEGTIDFVQVGNKIWYPRQAREKFIERYIVPAEHYPVKVEKLDVVEMAKSERLTTVEDVSQLCNTTVEEVYRWVNQKGYTCFANESIVFLDKYQVEEFCNRENKS